MNCPECKTLMVEDTAVFGEWGDLIEVVFKCPQCGVVFFGSLYKKEDEH